MTLDMQRFRRGGFLKEGTRLGCWSWSWPVIGTMLPARPLGALDYELRISGDAGTLWISRLIQVDPMGRPQEYPQQVISLRTTQPPFGGRRWWFVCPFTGGLVSKLHLPRGGSRFGSRAGLRLGYACQRETDADRSRRRARRMRAKIGGGGNLTERLPRKPKWMRWRTYDRHMQRVKQAEATVTAHAWKLIESLNRRLGKG